MKHGRLVAVLIVILAVLVLSCGFVYFSEDKTGPVIQVSSSEGDTYDESRGNEALLEGVTANDRRDGDVSDTLRVASVVPGTDGSTVTVTYAAKDKSNNVTELRRTMNTAGTSGSSEDTETADSGQQSTETVSSSSAAQQPAEDASAADAGQSQNADENNGNGDQQNTGDDAEAAAQSADEQAIAALPAGSPSIRLTTHETTIERGGEWNYQDYIASMSDDQDSTERLSRTINISGDVDTSRAGTYEITYSITDSNGNRSNRPVLNVTVQ